MSRRGHNDLTPTQRDILAFVQAHPELRGPQLSGALAAARGIRKQTAEGHIQRLVANGYLPAPVHPGSPWECQARLQDARNLLRECGEFLAGRNGDGTPAEREQVTQLRERIRQMV